MVALMLYAEGERPEVDPDMDLIVHGEGVPVSGEFWGLIGAEPPSDLQMLGDGSPDFGLDIRRDLGRVGEDIGASDESHLKGERERKPRHEGDRILAGVLRL